MLAGRRVMFTGKKKYNLIQLKVTLVDEEKGEMILTIA